MNKNTLNSALVVKGMTVRELAKMLRIRRSDIYAWIRQGKLHAISTRTATGRPRHIILPHRLAAFLKEMQHHPQEPEPATKRPPRKPHRKDRWPD